MQLVLWALFIIKISFKNLSNMVDIRLLENQKIAIYLDNVLTSVHEIRHDDAFLPWIFLFFFFKLGYTYSSDVTVIWS